MKRILLIIAVLFLITSCKDTNQTNDISTQSNNNEKYSIRTLNSRYGEFITDLPEDFYEIQLNEYEDSDNEDTVYLVKSGWNNILLLITSNDKEPTDKKDVDLFLAYREGEFNSPSIHMIKSLENVELRTFCYMDSQDFKKDGESDIYKLEKLLNLCIRESIYILEHIEPKK